MIHGIALFIGRLGVHERRIESFGVLHFEMYLVPPIFHLFLNILGKCGFFVELSERLTSDDLYLI